MSDYIIGRNPCHEALKSGAQIDKLFIRQGLSGGSVTPILRMARERRIMVVEVPSEKLDSICEGGVHQGVACLVPAFEYSSVAEITERAKNSGMRPLIVVCDGLSDPHNLGSVIRTAEAAGAHGVIIPKHNSVTLNQTVVKCAAGAASHIGIARVTNLTVLLKNLKENGYWILGTDINGEKSIYESDLSGPLAVVIGSEDKGISRLVKEECDFLAYIPMYGQLGSLNAAVAAGIVLFECVRKGA